MSKQDPYRTKDEAEQLSRTFEGNWKWIALIAAVVAIAVFSAGYVVGRGIL